MNVIQMKWTNFSNVNKNVIFSSDLPALDDGENGKEKFVWEKIAFLPLD